MCVAAAAAGVAVAATVASTAVSASSAGSAADAQAAALRDAQSAEERNQLRALEATRPFREAGEGAIEPLQDLLKEPIQEFSPSDPTASPFFRFQQEELERATDRATAARGNFFSGAALETLRRGNQQLIAEETERNFQRDLTTFSVNAEQRQERFNNLFNVFRVGSGQAQGDAGIIANSRVPALIAAQGAATATGIRQQGAAIAGGINSIGQTAAGFGAAGIKG